MVYTTDVVTPPAASPTGCCLEELVSAKYRLEDVDQAYQDLRDGKNIRGVIVH